MSSLSLVQCCLWTVTWWVPLVQQKLLTFIRAHEFTQPCSIFSLNSDTMVAPSAAEISYLYHSTWVHPALLDPVFEQWHGGCPYCSRNFLPLSEHMSSLNLIQSCLWTVTRCVPLVQQKLITFITAHEFTQPCSILSSNSDTMGAPSAAKTSYLYQSTWVHPALFNLVFEQWHDGCP